jgi:hypothetical protein
MPCNCLLFHDTCKQTYTRGGSVFVVDDQSSDACPAAPPSFEAAHDACSGAGGLTLAGGGGPWAALKAVVQGTIALVLVGVFVG